MSPVASFLPRPTRDERALSEAGQVVVLVAIAAVAAVVAIRLGMLVAPRLDRLTEPDDEDDGGDHD